MSIIELLPNIEGLHSICRLHICDICWNHVHAFILMLCNSNLLFRQNHGTFKNSKDISVGSLEGTSRSADIHMAIASNHGILQILPPRSV